MVRLVPTTSPAKRPVLDQQSPKSAALAYVLANMQRNQPAPRTAGEAGVRALTQGLRGYYAGQLVRGEREAANAENAKKRKAAGTYVDFLLGSQGTPTGASLASPEPSGSEVPSPASGASGAPGMTLQEAMIKQESGGRPDAVSPKGATGLMQIMPATAKNPGFGVTPFDPNKPLNDPEENKRFGTDYMAALQKRYGNQDDALRSYNAGVGRVDKWISAGRPEGGLPQETQDYVKSVAAMLRGNAGSSVARPSLAGQAQPQAAQIPTGTRDALVDALAAGYAGPQDLSKVLMQRMGYGGEERRIIKDAAGYNRYTGTGQRVFPNVEAAPNEKPPAGFRFDRPGGNLVPIEGGPATRLPAETAGRVALAQTAQKGFPQAANVFLDEKNGFSAGFATNFAAKRGKVGRARRTIRIAIESALRAATGAAAPETEVERFLEMFEPKPIDTIDTRRQKLNLLGGFLTNIINTTQQGRTNSQVKIEDFLPPNVGTNETPAIGPRAKQTSTNVPFKVLGP